jgi:hypothetical protein
VGTAGLHETTNSGGCDNTQLQVIHVWLAGQVLNPPGFMIAFIQLHAPLITGSGRLQVPALQF